MSARTARLRGGLLQLELEPLRQLVVAHRSEVDAQAVEDDSHLCARLAVFRPGRPDLADDLFDLLVDQVARLGLMFISHGRYSLRGLSRLWSSQARRSASAWVNSSRRFTRRTSSVSKWSGRSLKGPEHHCRTVLRLRWLRNFEQCVMCNLG